MKLFCGVIFFLFASTGQKESLKELFLFFVTASLNQPVQMQ
jgi:hypothetical protein